MKTQKFFTKLILRVLLLGMVISLMGCIPPQNEEEKLVISDKERLTSTGMDSENVNTLADGNTAFALDLYHTVKPDHDNLFYSPYSISLALAMTYAGARGETGEQMADTLHFGLPQEELHPAFNALDQGLTNLGGGVPEELGDAFQLNVANALWGQKDYSFLPQFLDTLSENYGAGLRVLDFAANPEDSRQIINQWVSDQTEEKIQDLIPKMGITPLTRLVLTNAIYFNATWMEPFSEDLTQEGIFHTIEGEVVSVPMMQHGQSKYLAYVKGDNYQAVELPYVGNRVSMLVLIPDPGQFSTFEEGLSPTLLEDIRLNLGGQSVSLTFPKFEYEAELGLAQTLAAMGMPAAFSTGADFSGMTGNLDLFISDVFHKAYVGVDEEGTEAAAATAVMMALTAMPVEGVELTVDRPFLFLIQEKETGTILFMGRVLDPTQ